MRRFILLILTALPLCMAGCASIATSDMHDMHVLTTLPDSTPVTQVRCTLRNSAGAWDVISPGYVRVRRSSDDLFVECRKEGVSQGSLRVTPGVSAWVIGNALSDFFSAGLGLFVDYKSGAGATLPDEIVVVMGASTHRKVLEEQFKRPQPPE